MPKPHAQQGMRVVFRAGDAESFLTAWAEKGLPAAVAKHGQDLEAGSPTIRDPRGFGVAGAYPRTGARHPAKLIERLYDEVGIFGAVVDEWSSETFAEAWTLQSEDDPEWAEATMEVFLDLDVPGVLEDADRNVLMHGKGVILWRLGDVQDPARDLPNAPPAGVEVLEIVSVPIQQIGKAVERPDAKAGEDLLKSLHMVLRGKRSVEVDAGRLTVIRERPVLDDPFEGKATLKKCIDSVILYENTKWWAGESFARRASPLVQAIIDPEAKLTGPAKEAIKEKLAEIISGTTQTAVVKDYKFEAVSGYSAIVNPQTQWTMAVDSVATDSRIPKHRLVGGAAGDGLSSAMSDEKRFLGRVSRRQERHGTRAIRQVIDRLVDLGAIKEPPEDWTVAWTPLDEPTILERAAAWEATGKALVQLKAAGAPYPEELTSYKSGKLPDDLNPAPDPPASGGAHPGQPGGPPAGPEDPAAGDPPMDPAQAASDAPSTPSEDPDLASARLAGQADVLAAYAAWSRRALKAFDGAAQGVPAPDDPVVLALMRLSLPATGMRRAVEALLEASGEAGGRAAFAKLQAAEAAPFRFRDDTPGSVFKALADTLGKQKADELSTFIRSSVARGVAVGESMQQLKARVLADFDFTEVEAARIARTEAMRGYNYGHREALRQVGAERYQLEVFGDACPICSPLDGHAFPIQDADHVPPLHPNCRCVMTQVPT